MTQVGILSALSAILGVFSVDKLGRNVEGRQQDVAFQGVRLAFFQSPSNVGDGLRHIRKELLHLLGRLQVEAVVGKSNPNSRPRLPT